MQTDPQSPMLANVRSVARACVTALAIGLGAWVLYATRGAVAAILASALAATALLHATDALVRRGWKRRWANAAVIGALVVVIGLFVGLLVPALFGQLSDLVEKAPESLSQIRHSDFVQRLASRYHIDLSTAPKQASQHVQEMAAPALSVLGGALTVLARFVMFVFLTIFMVLFGRDVVHAAISAAPAERRDRYDRVVGSVYESVGGYLAGLVLICTINATLTTTFLAISGSPFFLPLGILSGFSSLIPYAGPVVVHTGITAFAFGTGGVLRGAITAAYFLVYDNLEGNVLAPLVFKRTVHVNPLVSLVSVILLGEFAGVVGALIAVPAAAAGQIVLREYIEARRAEA